jgi:tight adherence protein C
MGIAITVFAVAFLLIASGGLLLFYREAMLQRIAEVINPQDKPKTLLSSFQESGFSLGDVVTHFDSVLPKSQKEVSVVKQRLIRAGMRKESTIKIFYGSKVLVPLILCIIALVTGLAGLSPFSASSAPTSGSRARSRPARRRSTEAFRTCSTCWSSALRPV